jgi:hypothetical protein
VGRAPVESVQSPRYCNEHMFDVRDRPGSNE